MRVTVLGAGVVGVASAWYLAADGHEVTVIERQPLPAQETSFANGGQISVSHAEPWANPRAPWTALKWLGREDAPLLWRLRADPAQWAWGLRFLRECTTARARANVGAIVRLGLASRAALQSLRRELGLEYDQLERGILHFYTDAREFEHAIPQAALMRDFGCERVPQTAAECLAIEPALAGSRVPIVGGTYTAGDESGDARKFTQALAQRAALRGVRFRHGETVAGLECGGSRLTGVRLASGECVAADITVLALGSYSPLFLKPLGIRLPVYPAKGYSVTMVLPDGVAAPTVSLTDDGHKIVISRLGQTLRVAGTAEFNGYDTAINPVRCAALRLRIGEVFPALAGANEVDSLAGLRPATPGNVPLVGDMSGAGLAGLWLNTGHGTLGWTLACGSGRLLADLVCGRDPGLDASPYRL
jgi:D-amino-acid dehydrogenase